jgi:hypothetical protein
MISLHYTPPKTPNKNGGSLRTGKTSSIANTYKTPVGKVVSSQKIDTNLEEFPCLENDKVITLGELIQELVSYSHIH